MSKEKKLEMRNFLVIGAVLTAIMFIAQLVSNSGITPNYFTPWAIVCIALIITSAIHIFFIEELVSLSVKIGAGAIALLIILSIISSGLVNDNKMATILSVENVDKKDIQFNSQRSVTGYMALKIANKVLGEKFEGIQISSQYEINRDLSSIQEVNGELVWVLPLDYSGFFKWLKRDSIPGYIIVSATNPKSQAKLVLDKKMIVSGNGYFMDSIDRIVYLESGLKEVDTHFEINDEGVPHFISLIMEPTFNFTGKKVSEVIITNATTGISETMTIEATMKNYPWIDRLVSEDYTEQKIEWFGSLQLGFWNTVFGGENINMPTNYFGHELWFVKANNKTYYFTGMSSTNSNDQSLVEGLLVDTITGEALKFDLSGVMDEAGAVSVLDSALGADSIKWDPVLPLPMIIDGQFYWASSIVSNSGIFQKAGIVNGIDQSETHFAKTFKLAAEKKNLTTSMNADSTESTETVTINKVVLQKILMKISELEELKKQLTK